MKKTIINKIDQLFPDPFIEHQIESWRKSKQDNFFKTLKGYLRIELSPKNIRDSYRSNRAVSKQYLKGKKGWALVKAIMLP